MRFPEVKWNVHERALNAYRSINISSQAFLVAAGAFLASKQSFLIIPVAFIAILIIWVIWRPIVIARHRVADYYRYALELEPLELQKLEELGDGSDYASKNDVRAAANELFKLKTNWRPTRMKLDLFLPLFYTLIWFALAYERVSNIIKK